MNDAPDTGGRVCRRCLLKEMDGTYFRSIYDYIHSLPEEQKAPAEEYDRRLALCKSCDELINGMCALCGCFVEVRAAKQGQHCARSAERW